MFLGLVRAGGGSASLRSPDSTPVPRVDPRLYGATCVRGSHASCYRRIRLARLARLVSRPGSEPVPRNPLVLQGKWPALLWRSRLLRGASGGFPAIPGAWWLASAVAPVRRAIPESRLAQWSLAYALPVLLVMAGESSQLFTFLGAEKVKPASLASNAAPAASAFPTAKPEPAASVSATAASMVSQPLLAKVEPQPVLADAAAEPFPALARKHLDRCLATHESLRLRRDLLLALARDEFTRRIEDQHERVRQTLQTHNVVAQALRVGTLRVEGESEATLRLEIYDSFESLECGTPHGGPDVDLFCVNLAGQRSEARDRYAQFVPGGGPIEVTNYGYSADFTADRNSNRYATGLGGTRPLIPGISAALSRGLAAKLDARPGAVIEFLDGRGRSYLVTYDDQSPQGNLNIDVYRPTYGSNNFRGHVKAARVLRQGASGICHRQQGLPFSLQNYRAALLNLAGKNRGLEANAAGSGTNAGGFPGAEAETAMEGESEPDREFELVEGSVPLARRLDRFANTPFQETGFATSQEILDYLQAGSKSLQEGIEMVRRHRLKVAEFPPILRMRANLEAAQRARQALAGAEARLRQECQDCESELFCLKVQASIEEDPVALSELQDRITALECSRTAILAQLDAQGGTLGDPAGGALSAPEQPAQVTATPDLRSAAPDS